jgi:PAS domain S-box-containing protein
MGALTKCARELISLTEQLGSGAGADFRFVLDPTSGRVLALGTTAIGPDLLPPAGLDALVLQHRAALLEPSAQTAGTLPPADGQPLAYAYVSRAVTLNDIALRLVELIGLSPSAPLEEPALLDPAELPNFTAAEVYAETRRLSTVMAPDGTYLDINDVGVRLFNHSREHILGRHAAQVLQLSGQEIRRLDQAIQACLRGQPQHLTWWYRAPQQAAPITADIALRPVRYAGKVAIHTLTRLLTDPRDPVHSSHLRNSQLELANFILTSANQFQQPVKLLEFVLRQLTTKAPVSGGGLYGYHPGNHQLRRLVKMGDSPTAALPAELNVQSDSSIVARLNRRRMRVAGRILAAEFGLAGVTEQTLAVLPVCSDDALLYVLLLIVPAAAAPQYGWVTSLLGLISDGINAFVTREQLRVELAEERQTADEALQRAEVQRQTTRELRNLLGSLSLAYLSFDREATILAVNDFFVEITGFAREELLGRNYFEVFVPEEAERARRLQYYVGRVLVLEEMEQQYESTIAAKSGERLIMRWNRLFERDQTGRITATISIGRDVTAGVLALEDSQRNRARFQDLFDNAHDLIQHLSPDNRFLLVNRAWHQTLGYSEADVRQLSLPDIVHPYYSAKLMHQLRALYRGEDVGQLETVLLTRAGRPVHLIGSVSAQWQDGQVVASRLILHDITERIQAERLQKAYYSIANLAISARDLDTLYGAIHRDLSRLLDTHNLFITLCDEARTRLTLVYVTDQRAGQGDAGDSRPFAKGAIEYIIRGGHPQLLQRGELEDLAGAGIIEMTGPIPEVLAGVPLAVGGRIIGALVVVDYTNHETYKPADLDVLHFISSQVALAIDRKRNELQLNRQNARLNAIFESGSHLMWSVSPTRQLTAYNRNFAIAFFDEETTPNTGPMLSVSAMDLPSPLDLRIVLAQNADMWEREYAAAFAGEARQFEVSTIRPDGSEAWAEIYLNPILLPDGTLEEVSGIAHDITEKKLAELELARQEELFRGIFESFQDVYYRTDARGRLVLLSPSVEANFGFIAPDLIGRSANTFFADPDDYQTLLTVVRDEGFTRGFEADFIDHTGQPHAVLINARRLQTPAGEPAGMEGLVMDISPLKQVQQDLLVAKQDAEAALHAKTQFLANMSHELRTPMNGIIGMIELLQHSVRTPQQIEYVETLRRSSDALLAILNDILDLSKIQAGKLAVSLAPVDLADVLAKVRALFANRAAQKQLSFTSDIAIDVPRFVQTDETRLLQILSNLTANAIKFTSHGGVSLHLTLAHPADEAQNELLDPFGDTAPVDLRFEVVDSGIGIATDDATRLFTDFTQLDTTSTKAYGGTGLGLSISRQLADLLGGTIGVRPNP